jgi:hypothetical protein
MMAIVQLSRITNRRGLQQDLPQLAPGELGWCLDSRLLFIGNGLLEEGSPAIGNTEVLTEFSDIKRLVEQIDGPIQFNIAGVHILDDAEGDGINPTTDSGFVFPNDATGAKLEYQIRRNNLTRMGYMDISFNSSGIYYSDNFVEPFSLGIVIAPVLSGGTKRLFYTTTATGFIAEFTGAIRYFT